MTTTNQELTLVDELLALGEEFADKGRHKAHDYLLIAAKCIESIASQPAQQVTNPTTANFAAVQTDSLLTSTENVLVQQVTAQPWYKQIEGMEVSIDVSTGEHDANNRIYGRINGVQFAEAGNGIGAILIEEESRNFAAPNAQPQDSAQEQTETQLDPHFILRLSGGKLSFISQSSLVHFANTVIKEWKARNRPSSAPIEQSNDAKDAARLDWLEKHMAGASDSERYLPFRIYWGGGSSRDIRKVIDAAMAQGGKE